MSTAEGIGDDLVSWRSGGAFYSDSVGIDLFTLTSSFERQALDEEGGADSVRSIRPRISGRLVDWIRSVSLQSPWWRSK